MRIVVAIHQLLCQSKPGRRGLVNGGSVADLSVVAQVVDGWPYRAPALVVGSPLTNTPFLAFASLAMSVILLGYAALVIVERSKRS
jgi:hypothetical protein